jgi:hypothetical protein
MGSVCSAYRTIKNARILMGRPRGKTAFVTLRGK